MYNFSTDLGGGGWEEAVILNFCVPCISQKFKAYNQQIHYVFETSLYLKTPTFFDASMHHIIIIKEFFCYTKLHVS